MLTGKQLLDREIQGMNNIIQCTTLWYLKSDAFVLWNEWESLCAYIWSRRMGSTKKYRIIDDHARTGFLWTFLHKQRHKPIQFMADLSDMLIHPNRLVVVFWKIQKLIQIKGIFSDQRLDVLLDGQWRFHLFQCLNRPCAPVLIPFMMSYKDKIMKS